MMVQMGLLADGLPPSQTQITASALKIITME